jgi:hypothetical protein
MAGLRVTTTQAPTSSDSRHQPHPPTLTLTPAPPSVQGDFAEGDTVRVEASGSAEEGLILVREGGPRPGSAGGAPAADAAAAQQPSGGGGDAAGGGDKPAKPAAPKRRVVISRKASVKDREAPPQGAE